MQLDLIMENGHCLPSSNFFLDASNLFLEAIKQTHHFLKRYSKNDRLSLEWYSEMYLVSKIPFGNISLVSATNVCNEFGNSAYKFWYRKIRSMKPLWKIRGFSAEMISIRSCLTETSHLMAWKWRKMYLYQYLSYFIENIGMANK